MLNHMMQACAVLETGYVAHTERLINYSEKIGEGTKPTCNW